MRELCDILLLSGAVSVRLGGRVPARSPAGEAVPHLPAVQSPGGMGAAQGGPARRRLRPHRGHGAARTRWGSSTIMLSGLTSVWSWLPTTSLMLEMSRFDVDALLVVVYGDNVSCAPERFPF